MALHDLPAEIDLADVGRVLKSVEARLHRDGWHRDAHVHVWVLYDHRQIAIEQKMRGWSKGHYPAVRSQNYTARVLLGPDLFRHVRPWEKIRTIAMSMAYGQSPEENDFRQQVRMTEGLVGFIYAAEAWGRNTTADELIAELSEGPVDYGTMPDRVEVRSTMCVDAWDRVHLLHRRRGEKPALGLDAPIRGDVSTSLRIMMDTAYDRLPAPERFNERYPTLAEAAAAAKAEEGELAREPDWSSDNLSQ